jgi:hypothetical protein
MAKISAYGEHKVAEARFTRPKVSEDFIAHDLDVEYVWVLTSGGRVLERAIITHNYPGNSRTRPSTSGYRLVARIQCESRRNLETLASAIERRGYNLKES